jgi:hypothetical protein
MDYELGKRLDEMREMMAYIINEFEEAKKKGGKENEKVQS